MTVAAELQNLNDNLLDAYDAVSAKSGTVPTNKNTDNLADAITSIPAGGGATRPSTWAEFAAMTVSQMQAVYGVGDRVAIPCLWRANYNLMWEIAGFGTTKRENDSTVYPCVTLVARLSTPDTYQFDAPETAVPATEGTAQDGVYYFGYNGSYTTMTPLNLSAGDSIPYADYTAVYKTDVTNSVSIYNEIRQYGYSAYRYSNIRQWLNSEGAANSWWTASHVGDARPSYSSQAGFMAGMPSEFKAILQRTEVQTTGDTKTMSGDVYTDYDYFFVPSAYECYIRITQVEGDRLEYFTSGGAQSPGLTVRGQVSNQTTSIWGLRTPYQTNAYTVYAVSNRGGQTNSMANGANPVVPACKIILAGA